MGRAERGFGRHERLQGRKKQTGEGREGGREISYVCIIGLLTSSKDHQWGHQRERPDRTDSHYSLPQTPILSFREEMTNRELADPSQTRP